MRFILKKVDTCWNCKGQCKKMQMFWHSLSHQKINVEVIDGVSYSILHTSLGSIIYVPEHIEYFSRIYIYGCGSSLAASGETWEVFGFFIK